MQLCCVLDHQRGEGRQIGRTCAIYCLQPGIRTDDISNWHLPDAIGELELHLPDKRAIGSTNTGTLADRRSKLRRQPKDSRVIADGHVRVQWVSSGHERLHLLFGGNAEQITSVHNRVAIIEKIRMVYSLHPADDISTGKGSNKLFKISERNAGQT